MARNYSAKLVYGTGFSVLSFEKRSDNKVETYKLDHISADKCEVSDTTSVSMVYSSGDGSEKWVIIGIVVVFGILFIGSVAYAYYKCQKRNQKENGAVEMVEETDEAKNSQKGTN